jgi:DNA replication protein DnaC
MAECASCGGTGWVRQEVDGYPAARPCPQCRLSRRTARRLEAANIPPRYADRGFDLYSTHNPSQEAALKKAVDYVEAWPRVDRGLLWAGPCGVGKTHLAVAVLKTLVEEKGVAGRFIDESELLRRLQFSYGPDSPDTEREVLLPLMDVELLVWDDLGTGRPTDWVRETVGMVLNHRYTNKRPTLMTTNWPLQRRPQDPGSVQTLEERVGVRLYSRILEMCEIVPVEGPDARAQIHKAGLDFWARRRAAWSVPSGLVSCPHCRSVRVTVDSQSTPRRSTDAVQLECTCTDCSRRFTARFFPATAKVEYCS